MASEWPTETVAELQRKGILLVEDGNHGEYRPRPNEFVDYGVAFIRAGDMDEGRILFDSAAKITEQARVRITKGIGSPGDVLLSHKGTVGKVALAPNDSPPFVCSPQTTFWRTRDENRLNRRYLYAFLRSPNFRAQLSTRAGETDMAPYVSLTAQRGLSVVLPPITEQRAIADILGSLDDKIEINRRMNATLEAMARAIFKSWFVDFDPVRAKAEGRAPEGLAPEIVALFPDAFEDSELGRIPKGWKVKALTELIETNPSRSLRKGEMAPYLDMANVPTHTARADKVTERKFGSGTKFKNGDTLLARITPCLENGKTAYVDFLEENQIGWGSTEFIVLRPKSPLPPEFAYFLSRDEDFRAFAIANMSGTSGRQRVPADCFSRYPLAVPTPDISSAFGQFACNVMRKIKGNDEESRTLATLRDTLLPKLLSGELRTI